MTVSTTHLVLLPAYNPGSRLAEVVAEVLRHWQPVLAVIDGSTDGSERPVQKLAETEPALTVLILPRNSGKGAAVLAGAEAARARGFTHALVMDADGQHPAASIAEFMTASHEHPKAMILGRPVFPANIPLERLHGRKLSVALVHFELLSRAVADPLFGFRVYPLVPLLDVLGSRSGGRRYDFDTEAVVRLGWAGIPARNLAAPVRYFSRADGGISHFHYVRDNLVLVWLHLRLLAELLLWRWPAALRHRRAAIATAAALLAFVGVNQAHPMEPRAEPVVREISPTAPEWADLVSAFAHHPDTTADFTEQRFFPFKRNPVELKGEVRVSAEHGLSLHYLVPEERIVILDARGVLVRDASGDQAAPADPHAAAANDALLHILRFDFAALGHDFVLSGWREGASWKLTAVPRTDELRYNLGWIAVTGEDATVRHIEIRRSTKQAIEIAIAAPRSQAAFTAAELKRFFR